ncbi:DUF4235 domain-containing protein [Actinoplanes sp. NPDC049118]|uniref:DUF4235 domain-containing protein n=1 Tax=Actinoplanes sp. NPDC049118 TaxID=3155769 RepID=UPI003402DB26
MTRRTTKIAYRPVGWLAGAGAGAVAGLLFKQTWKLVGHDDDAPNATDEDRGWGEILLAAAIQGAIFALVKAAVERAGATGVRRATGEWPA